MVDAIDSKSIDGNIVRVQVSPPTPTEIKESIQKFNLGADCV